MKQLEIQIIMEEYKSLRSEIQQSKSNRNTILSFGLATLGLLFHAGISVLTNPSQMIAFYIFCFLLPSLSMLILILWLGEVQRMRRIALYLSDFENRLNSIFCKENLKLLRWENWLREVDHQGKVTLKLLYPYYAVISLFTGIALFSLTFIIFNSTITSIFKIISCIIMYGTIFTICAWIYKKGKNMKSMVMD